MRNTGIFTGIMFLAAACGAATSAPVATTNPPPSGADLRASVVVEAPVAAVPNAAPVPPPSDRGGPLVVAFTPFGRVAGMYERKPLWSLPPAAPRRASSPARYERWREKARANVGYGYLSILDLTLDERFLLVVSEEEAKLRLYDFPGLHLVTSQPVAGYRRFARGDFVFAPPGGDSPAAVFAGESGIMLLDTTSPRAALLSSEVADTLRWSDDHAVLGATASAIPEQRSRLGFYAFGPNGALEPLLLLDFAERVEEWALDSTKRRLAVTYYPSNQTELLDLAARTVLWSAPAPQYANSVDISPDDERVAVGGSSLMVHDITSGVVVGQAAHFGNNIHRVRYSPSGDALAVSSYEGKIRIFDARGPGPALPLRKLLRHSGTANVYAIAFTGDGSALVSGSGDKTVRVWGE
jgi:hypothetical protein